MSLLKGEKRFAPSFILLLKMTLQLTTHRATFICPLLPHKSVLWGPDCTCTSPSGQTTIPYPPGQGPTHGSYRGDVKKIHHISQGGEQ